VDFDHVRVSPSQLLFFGLRDYTSTDGHWPEMAWNPGGLPMSQTQNEGDAKIIFGFREEWLDFERRNARFLERFPELLKTLETAFSRDVELSEPIDKFVFMFGRVCVENLSRLDCAAAIATVRLPRSSCEGSTNERLRCGICMNSRMNLMTSSISTMLAGEN